MNPSAERILVVDDELGMREGCRKVLALDGYAITTAEDGLAGLETFQREGPFAAALVDLNMPRMGGLELIEKLKLLSPDTVLFVITAYATIETAVEATRRGAYDYIPKPFTPDELLLPVRRGLEKRTLEIQARQMLQERQERLLELAYERSQSAVIINRMTDGVLVINRDRQIVLHNAALEGMLPGCARLPEGAALEVLECPTLGALFTEVAEADLRPMIALREMELGGQTYQLMASPVDNPATGLRAVVVVFHDITALKQLATAKSLFVSMVAHEIKSPLAAVEGYLDTLLHPPAGSSGGTEQSRRLLERCLLRINALRTMVSELLNLTAMETGRFTLTRVPVELGPLVTELAALHQESAQRKQVHLELAAETNDPLLLMADRDALGIALGNLVDNAIKYTPEGGWVRIGVTHDERHAMVTITDSGIGMTSQEAERAFDEFFRAKNSFTVQVPGTGLGLAIVKRLMDMHQGQVALSSTPGQGTTFTLTFPRA